MAHRQMTKSGSLLHVLAAYVAAAAVAAATAFAVRGLDPIGASAVADLAATLCIFAASLRYKNASVYDPYWSVAALCIVAAWTVLGPYPGPAPARSLFVPVLVLWWGTRLTYNWVQRWRGLDDEDWRYDGFRKSAGSAFWLVSLFGIHLFPTVLVFMACLPAYPVLTSHNARPFGLLDTVATAVTTAAIWIEGRADRELRQHRRRPDGGTSVLATGVWAWCRHPNYLGEIAFWWGLFLFGIAADPTWWWSALGPIAITVLFVTYSVPALERRHRQRRSGWDTYAARTPALLPRPPRAD